MNTDWITIGEAADILQVSRDTLRRWEKKGKIKSYRSPSNRRMYKRAEITESYHVTDIQPDVTPSPPPSVNPTASATSAYPFSSLPKITQTPPAPTPFRPNANNNLANTQTSNFKPFTSTNENPPTTSSLNNKDYKTLSPLPTPNLPITPDTPTSPPTYVPNFDYPKPNYLNNNSTPKDPPSTNESPSKPESTPSSIKTEYKPLTNTSPSITQIPTPPPTPAPITPPSPPVQTSPTNNWTPSPSITTPATPSYSTLTIEDVEPKDNTVKILKFITAILITILIILAIAIFSIIFMQYT